MNEPFHTADVDLAAFLRCRGIRYIDIAANPENVQLADFVFESSDALYRALRDWHGEGPDGSRNVDAREFGRVRRMFYKSAQRYLRARA